MTTIRISEETAHAINELGGTFDKPDEVLQRIIREAGHGHLLDEKDSTTERQTDQAEGTRTDWIDSWLDQFSQTLAGEAETLRRPSGHGGADFALDEDCVGKIRISKSWKRDQDTIWLRFDPEVTWAKERSDQRVISVVLDLYDRSPAFTEEDQFFVLDEEMLLSETTESGDATIEVQAPGTYEPPFDQYANDWTEWF